MMRPTSRLPPLPPLPPQAPPSTTTTTIPVAVDRAFRAATDQANARGACYVKARMWEHDNGYQYQVESTGVDERTLRQRRLDELQHAVDMRKVEFEALHKALAAGLIESKEYFENLNMKH